MEWGNATSQRPISQFNQNVLKTRKNEKNPKWGEVTFHPTTLWGHAGPLGYRPPWLLVHGEAELWLGERVKVFTWVVRGVEG